MDKKIKFIANSDLSYRIDVGPIPAVQSIPQWYKDVPLLGDNPKATNDRERATLKACSPFFDVLSAGYLICVEQDIEVTDKDGKKYLEYLEPNDHIFEDEHQFRIGGLPVPYGFSKSLVRLTLYPHVITPKGYSTLFSHPFNRMDLPFYSYSAIVATDEELPSVSATISIREDFTGIIKAGTPLIQALPFKRESWKHDNMPAYSEKELHRVQDRLFDGNIRNYKSKFWKKTTYK